MRERVRERERGETEVARTLQINPRARACAAPPLARWREKERENNRQTNIQTDRQIEKAREREREKEREESTARERERERERERDRERSLAHFKSILEREHVLPELQRD